MSIPLYMDAHVPHAITSGLRQRGVDVLTAQEDGTDTLPDPDLLDHATSLGRVLVTSDHDFEVEAAKRQSANIPFAGIIYVRVWAITLGQAVDELELMSVASAPEELANLLSYVPL